MWTQTELATGNTEQQVRPPTLLWFVNVLMSDFPTSNLKLVCDGVMLLGFLLPDGRVGRHDCEGANQCFEYQAKVCMSP